MLIFFTNQKPKVAIGATKITDKVKKTIERKNSGNYKFRDPEYYHIAIVVDNERNDIYIESGKTVKENEAVFEAVRILTRAVISEYRSRYERVLPQIVISMFGPDNGILMNYVQNKGHKWGCLQDLVPQILQ